MGISASGIFSTLTRLTAFINGINKIKSVQYVSGDCIIMQPTVLLYPFKVCAALFDEFDGTIKAIICNNVFFLMDY